MTKANPARITLTLTDLENERVSISMGFHHVDGTELDGTGPLTPAMLMSMGGQALFRSGFFAPVGTLIATAVEDGIDDEVVIEKLSEALQAIDIEAIYRAAGGTIPGDGENVPEGS